MALRSIGLCGFTGTRPSSAVDRLSLADLMAHKAGENFTVSDEAAKGRVDELHIFGDSAAFRRALNKRLVAADGLRARALALRDQLRALPSPTVNQKMGFLAAMARTPVLQGVISLESSTAAWRRTNDQVLGRYLGAAATQFRLGPRDKALLASGAKNDFAVLDQIEGDLNRGSAILHEVLVMLPAAKTVEARPLMGRFAEVRQSRLIHEQALDSYLRRMSNLKGTAHVSSAIGASKELVEACNRAACMRLGVADAEGDFLAIGKAVRKELGAREALLPQKSARAVQQLFAGFSSVENALATLRNDVGTGHGRAQLPPGLRARHGQLAIDAADTYTRYIVETLRDLKLL